jgi:hypothetical protein
MIKLQHDLGWRDAVEAVGALGLGGDGAGGFGGGFGDGGVARGVHSDLRIWKG